MSKALKSEDDKKVLKDERFLKSCQIKEKLEQMKKEKRYKVISI